MSLEKIYPFSISLQNSLQFLFEVGRNDSFETVGFEGLLSPLLKEAEKLTQFGETSVSP